MGILASTKILQKGIWDFDRDYAKLIYQFGECANLTILNFQIHDYGIFFYLCKCRLISSTVFVLFNAILNGLFLFFVSGLFVANV